MISDDEISHNQTARCFFFPSLPQLHVGSSRFISAPTLGWLGGFAGWWVVGLPSFPSAQPSPALPTSSPCHHLPLTCMRLNQTNVIPSFAFSTHIPVHVLGVLSRVDALCVHKITMTRKKKEKTKKHCQFWNKQRREKRTALIDWVVDGLVFRLRSVKMEQRKLNDQANSLVDLAKVRRTHSVLLHCT